MEASAEFYSVPKLWFIGANRDAFSSNTWTSLIQAINAISADEDGNLPQLQQVQQASMTPHSDMLKTMAMLVASQTRADAFTKIADKVTGYADSDVGLERLGLSREEITRLRADQRKARAERRGPAQDPHGAKQPAAGGVR